MEYFRERDDLRLNISVGEIAVAPWRDEVLAVLRERKWRSLISTNASVFNQDMAELLREGRLRLSVNLDSGTPETFARIKGVDCFAEVIENVEKYAARSGGGDDIFLKYLILEGINDNAADIDAFVDIARQCGTYVVIARDSLLGASPLPEPTLSKLIRLAEASQAAGLRVVFSPENFVLGELDKLREIISATRAMW